MKFLDTIESTSHAVNQHMAIDSEVVCNITTQATQETYGWARQYLGQRPGGHRVILVVGRSRVLAECWKMG